MNTQLQSASRQWGCKLPSTRASVRAYFTPLRDPGPTTPYEPREVLRKWGHLGDDTFNRVNRMHYGALERLDPSRLLPVLLRLNKLELNSQELQLVLIRYPNTFSHSEEDVESVLTFLQLDLGLEGEQLRSVITKFPQVFSFSVKAHLKPQLAYLLSLGVEPGQLRDFVVARPLLLGEGIETVIKFLRLCGVPRRQMASLLRSYPIDYCCRFIYKTTKDAPADS